MADFYERRAVAELVTEGKELFYEEVSSSRIMVAAYAASGGEFQPEKPRPWTSNSVPLLQGAGRPFDVSPDGNVSPYY